MSTIPLAIPSIEPNLTPRELQVVKLIAEGNTNKIIAGQLGIAVKTVQAHRENIYRKLVIQGNGGAKLTRYALARGLITI